LLYLKGSSKLCITTKAKQQSCNREIAGKRIGEEQETEE